MSNIKKRSLADDIVLQKRPTQDAESLDTFLAWKLISIRKRFLSAIQDLESPIYL